MNTTYESANGGVAVLERPCEVVENATATYSDQESRIKSNLDKLLNYDKYAPTVSSTAEEAVSKVVAQASTLADEDIRPTSTTMQFGEDIDQITRDMSRSAAVAQDSYQINKKGKVAVMLYALVVTVILALIILNTGVLASLSSTAEQKAAEFSAIKSEASALAAENEYLQSNERIVEEAMKLGMVQK
ncbi:MAG: hypothetical protein E7340_05895 [Clostridiales bacterium]|nr:hypothetical protein [Clostridiales bacterium]